MKVKKLGSCFYPNLRERVVKAFREGKKNPKSKLSPNGVIFKSLKLVKTLKNLKSTVFLKP